MVLDYLRRPVGYSELLTTLQVTAYGTRRSLIRNLTRFGVSVTYHEANWEILCECVAAGLPVIAFVNTGNLRYWNEAVQHSVVVTGCSADGVTVNDPAADMPQTLTREEFELAWQECDYFCAILSL